MTTLLQSPTLLNPGVVDSQLAAYVPAPASPAVGDVPTVSGTSPTTYSWGQYVQPAVTPAAGVTSVREPFINAASQGVKADGTTDDTAAWNTVMGLIGSGGGGILMPSTGTPSIVKQTIYLPNKTVLRGQGRNASIIQAASGGTGFAGSGVIQLGKVADTQVFGTRLENLQVDANNIAPSALFSNAAQEQSGTRDVLAQNGTTYAVNLGSGCADCMFDGEFYVASAGTYAVYVNGCPGTITIKGTASGGTVAATAGIYALNMAGQLVAIGTHHEHCTDGIVFDNSAGVVVGATGPAVAATVTNMVHMKNNSRYVTIHGLFKGAATNAFTDDFFGKTVTDSFIESAVLGTIWTARLNHYGDQVGFFNAAPVGKPTVTGSKGANAALTSLMSALSTLGLVTDSTT